MNKQNVTLSLPRSLLKKARVLALTKDKSLSELLRDTLEEKVREDTGYEKSRTRQLNLLNNGLDLGTKGHVTISRIELHARR